MKQSLRIFSITGTLDNEFTSFVPNPQSAVLFCHGLGSWFGNTFALEAEEFVRIHKLADASLRFSMHEHVEGVTDLRQFSFQGASNDFDAALAALSTLGIEKVSIVASSFGAQVLLTKLANGLRPHQVFLRAALVDFMRHRLTRVSSSDISDWKARGWFEFPVAGRIAQLSASLIQELHVAAVTTDYSMIPPETSLTCIHGTADETIPYAVTQEALRKISHAKFVLIEGANHAFSESAHRGELLEILRNRWR